MFSNLFNLIREFFEAPETKPKRDYQNSYNKTYTPQFQQNQQLKQLNINYLYHMTNINNLSSIFKNGLLSHNQAHQLRNIADISDRNVQDIRSSKIVNHRYLHDYVPLYFSPRNPMLYRRKDIQNRIVMLGIQPGLLLQSETIFSDGNAASKNTQFFHDSNSLSNLPWHIINADFWTNFADGKRIKCAEVLVYPGIAVENIIKVFCHSINQASLVKSIIPANFGIKVEVNQDLYF